jgi:release factor glutamine methyltransferase
MLRFLSSTFFRPLVSRYLSKERRYHYKGIYVTVLPGVFHPGFFFSTRFLLKYLENINLKEKRLLELGAGSGLIAFYAESKGAIVTATDLSDRVIRNLKLNKDLLHSKVTVNRSNLFDEIPVQAFDVIVINPPYYPKNPQTESQLAWYCGENFEYFEKLFTQLTGYMDTATRVLMVLSEDCDVEKIESIAKTYHVKMIQLLKEKFWFEWNYIYEIGRA